MSRVVWCVYIIYSNTATLLCGGVCFLPHHNIVASPYVCFVRFGKLKEMVMG